jgi:hypothetical protein
MNKKLFAFWRHGSFPCILGGDVGEIREGGRAYIPSYQGTFQPIVVLPEKEGKKILSELRGITIEYETAQRKLREEYLAKVHKIAPWVKEKK